MGTGFIRFGGVCALLVIGVGLLALIVGAASPGAMRNKAVSLGFAVVVYALLIVLYLATKSLWNRYGRHGGNLPIFFLIFATLVSLVLNVTGGAAGGLGQGIGIAIVVVMVLYVVAWLWLSIYCIVAGNSAGGLWKAVGILYLVATLLGTIALGVGFGAFAQLLSTGMSSPGGFERAMQSSSGVIAGVMGFFGVIALIVALAGLICHAIALLIGAGRLDNAR